MVIINADAAAAQNNKMTSNTSWASSKSRQAGPNLTPYESTISRPLSLSRSLSQRSPFQKYFHIKNRVFCTLSHNKTFSCVPLISFPRYQQHPQEEPYTGASDADRRQRQRTWPHKGSPEEDRKGRRDLSPFKSL